MSDIPQTNASLIEQLVSIMARLRHLEEGCPWDLQQDFSTIVPYTIEEAFEVAEAIARGDRADLCDELGDLLFQVVFHARLAEEEGSFVFADVVNAINDKMIRRHPHVFGDQQGASLDEIHATWESTKTEEQRQKGQQRHSALDGVPEGLPALQRASKIQKKAASVGFDWPETPPVLAQVRAELDELEAAMASGQADATEDELGDVLFSVVNLARHLKSDPDGALRRASNKFERRFRRMETLAADQSCTLSGQDTAALEALWRQAKMSEMA